MKGRLLVCLTLSFFALSLYGQSQRISSIFSLKKELEKNPSLERSAFLLLHLGEAFRPVNLDSARYYLRKGVKLADEVRSPSLAGHILVAYADALAPGRDPETEGFYQKALEYFKLAEDKESEIETICRLCSYEGGAYPHSYYIDFLKEALHFTRQNELVGQEGYVLYVLGRLYAGGNEFRLAEQAFQESIASDTQNAHKNPGAAISELGNLYYHKGYYKKALSTYETALPYLEKEDDFLGFGYMYCNIGSTQEKLGLYDYARQSLNLSVYSRGKVNDLLGMKYTCLEMSQLMVKQNDLISARNWLNQAHQKDSVTFIWEEDFTRGLIALEEAPKLAKSIFHELEKRPHPITTDCFEMLLSTAGLYLEEGKLDSAELYANEASEFANVITNGTLNAQAHLMFAQIRFQQNRGEEAVTLLEQALTFFPNEESPVTTAEILGHQAMFLHKLGKQQEAGLVFNRLKVFSEMAQLFERNFRLSALVDEYDLNLKKEELQHLNAAQQKQLIWGSLLAIFILLSLVYAIHQRYQKRQLSVNHQNAQQHFNETIRNRELEIDNARRTVEEEKDRELAAQALQMVQQTELIDSVKKKLTDVERKLDGEVRAELRSTVRNLDTSLLNQASWENFSAYFERVHPDFFGRVQTLYPRLTTEDLRYCAYMKANMTNREIADLLHINIESVRVHKYRLKKKMELEKDVDLAAYVRSV